METIFINLVNEFYLKILKLN